MTNKYLEKIARILPNFKKFDGIVGATKTALKSDAGIEKAVEKSIAEKRPGGMFNSAIYDKLSGVAKPVMVANAKNLRGEARKEVGKAVGIGAGTVAAGTGVYALTKKKK